MSKTMIGVATILGLIVILALGYFAMSMTYTNKEITLRNGIDAQQKSCGAYYDKLWKIISQKAQIADQYKTGFKDVYASIMEGRYDKDQGGSLMRFITESNPQFDASLYADLSRSVEAQREGFFTEQERLIDLQREHKDLIQKVPGHWFLGDKQEITITIVTSATTKDVMRTGEENDVDVFRK